MAFTLCSCFNALNVLLVKVDYSKQFTVLFLFCGRQVCMVCRKSVENKSVLVT